MLRTGQLPGFICLLALLLLGFAPPAQVASEPVTLSVQAGFDGYFRENLWIPLYISAANDGPTVEGQLIVRPETSGSALNSAYSTPISLPSGARKSAFLYIKTRGFADQIRVELVDNQGVVIAAAPAAVRNIQPEDQLYVVVSQAAAGSVSLTGVRSGNHNAVQVNWQVETIPDRVTALTPINLLLFSDVDTGNLSTDQRQAIADWVAQGGHLIVTGGPNWQATAAGFTDLLPLIPDNSATLDDLGPLADWLRYRPTTLVGPAVVATGALQPGAQPLVGVPDGDPLIARRAYGHGTVDYVTFDPNTQPLRGWAGLTDLWFALAVTVSPTPSWAYGFYSWDQASNAANILPGVNLLPDILPLCGFLGLYIILIGPLNYLLLNRFNRREYAWLSIPLLIILFTGLSWVIGSNLRGNEVTLSRLSIVQTWPETPRAQVNEILGLLSPRRATYSVSIFNDSFLQPLPPPDQNTLMGGNPQTSATVQQTDHFRAADLPVDASFIATFHASTFVEKPRISGQTTIFYDGPEGQQIMRGSVRNDSQETLTEPIILARGTSYRLNGPLRPGEVMTFDLTLPGESLPAPAPIAYTPGGFTPILLRSYAYQTTVPQTVRDILGDRMPQRGYFRGPASSAPGDQESYRRYLFLSSFINDPYSTTSGRGSHAYLAAWTDRAPLSFELEGAKWSSLDSTLYLVQLETEVVTPAGEVLIPAEQFTWTVKDRVGLDDLGPIAMVLQDGDEVVFQFTPLPASVLNQVDELMISVDRNNLTARVLPLQIWNWDLDQWQNIRIDNGHTLTLRRPARYLGPQNAVQLRIAADDLDTTYPRIQDLTVEQRGRF